MTRDDLYARAVAYEFATSGIHRQHYYRDLHQSDLEVFWGLVTRVRTAVESKRLYAHFWTDQGAAPRVLP